MNSDQAPDRLSRRKMLKRIGTGAAVVWTAPVLTSMRTPAFAASGTACLGIGCFSDCSITRNSFPACPDVCMCGPNCVYAQDTSGVCRNFEPICCACVDACRDNSQCPEGYFCVCTWMDCGLSVCVPCCGNCTAALCAKCGRASGR